MSAGSIRRVSSLLMSLIFWAGPGGPQPVSWAANDAKAPSLDKVALSPALRSQLGKRATVVVFLGVGCPVSNAYLPQLKELARKYEPQDVRFIGVNANDQDSAEDVTKHAKEFALAFPVLKDDGQRIADALGAERVPEAVVLDGQEKVRYRGRVDDAIGVIGRKDKPTRADLALALDELLAGKEVSVPRTEVSGCLIGRAKARPAAPVTYSDQVVRIVQKKCQSCHRAEGVAPFTLASYEETKAWGQTIKEVVTQRRMPPWHADPRYGKFSNDRSLTPSEIDTLVAWVDGGTTRGNDKDLPPPAVFPKGRWTIGEPDVQLAMSKEFAIPATGVLPYQDFIVETGFKEDRWIERAQLLPGSKAVHHAVVFIDGPGEQWLCTYVPGDSPLILPPGTAKKVPAGAKLRFNMHYTASGKVEHDRSVLGLIFAKEPPKQEVRLLVLDKKDIQIAPEAANHREAKDHPVSRPLRVQSLFPHMHLRGKSWECQVVYADGRAETVLQVPRYDFNWQHTYRLAEPLLLPAGATLRCVAHYDNSANNPNNPDPAKTIKWGPQSWDEMMVLGVEYLTDIRGDTGAPNAAANERLPSAQLAAAAKVLIDTSRRLDALPVRIDGDAAKAFGMRSGQRAAVIIPEQRLTAAALAGVGREVLPVGQLWLRDWTVILSGQAAAAEKVRSVDVSAGKQSTRLALYLLGVRKNAEGTLELVLYAQGSEPVAALPLQAAVAKQEVPIELETSQSERSVDTYSLGLLGKYRTTLGFTAPAP